MEATIGAVISAIPTSPKVWIDGLVIYNSFFLSRYVGNDIQNMCGSFFDAAIPKSIILYIVIYAGSRNVVVSLVIGTIMLFMQWWMSRKQQCMPYKERSSKTPMVKNLWIEPATGATSTVTPTVAPPTPACGAGMCSLTPH